MSARRLRLWLAVHKWTSLACTAFLLLLCVTGLPLIFTEEIGHLTGRHPEAAEAPPGAGTADLDRLVADALAARPGEVAQYVSFDDHEPLVYVTTGPSAEAAPEQSVILVYDARTGERIDAPPFDEGFMWVLYELHTDMYAGLPGMLFLGIMGLLFVAALVSGVVIYGPFMRRLRFGEVRSRGSARLGWLDLHNLLGIATLAWAVVVGLTGAINTLAEPMRAAWQAGQLAEMTAPYAGRPPAGRLAPLERALAVVREAAPGMTPGVVAFPGTPFSSRNHYAVFLRGETPLTRRLFTPALVDAETGALTAIRPAPWYMTALFVSQPLHFGDYGGLAMKVVWALLDLVAIVVLGSGLYLWLARRKTSLEARLAELPAAE